MITYIIHLEHDRGKTRLRVEAESEHKAIERVCHIENCPKSAIIGITPLITFEDFELIENINMMHGYVFNYTNHADQRVKVMLCRVEEGVWAIFGYVNDRILLTGEEHDLLGDTKYIANNRYPFERGKVKAIELVGKLIDLLSPVKILELSHAESGFVATEYENRFQYDIKRIGVHRGDIGNRPRSFWRNYARKNNCILKEVR